MDLDPNMDLGATPATFEAPAADPAPVVLPVVDLPVAPVGESPAPVAPVVEILAPTPEAQAAQALAAEYALLPGIPPALGALITGSTIAEVKASFAAIRAGLQELEAARVPGARGGGPVAPAPQTAFDMIKAGVAAAERRAHR